jgi:hypothetical protein
MTKRWLYRLSVGLATFAVGLSLTLSWNAHRAISLCELEADPSSYAGKTVRFRAIVERTKYMVIACSVCGTDTAACVSLELDPGEVARFTLPESLITRGEGDQIYLMDAVVVGRLDPHFGLGCFAPKYRVTNARVERVLSVRQFEDIPQAVEWMKSNSY